MQPLSKGLYHIGPSLDHGPLPSLFYFSLSGPDSLTLDPFNQIVQFLRPHMIRVFSLTLPGHENGLPATNAMNVWAEDIAKGINCVSNFLDQAEEAVQFAINEQFVDPKKIATAGLSRGAMIAAHLAARVESIDIILGFAPLTCLSRLKEFAHLQDNNIANSLDLNHIAPKIADRHIRLYIGNHDTRVGTRQCLDFAMNLVDHKTKRHSNVELFMTPSIGRDGHGTAPEIFKQGADWIAHGLNFSSR